MNTWLIEIDANECRDLLETATFGRLGVIVDGRPQIFPVSHVYDRETGSIVFSSNERTKMRSALAWPWVAFEVDGLEPGGDGGWSVLVVGHAEEVTDDEEIARLTGRRRAFWVGPATHWLRVVPSTVTGRRIHVAAR